MQRWQCHSILLALVLSTLLPVQACSANAEKDIQVQREPETNQRLPRLGRYKLVSGETADICKAAERQFAAVGEFPISETLCG